MPSRQYLLQRLNRCVLSRAEFLEAMDLLLINGDKLDGKIVRSNGFSFFLWGFMENRVYVNNPQSIDELKNNIRFRD